MRADDPAELSFAAFYADCVHEVLPVTGGYRMTLVYNLVRDGRGGLPEPPAYEPEQAKLADLLNAWRQRLIDADSADPIKLIYLLDHAYTPAELGFQRLKGADAAAAQVLAASARQARCDALLALLTIQEDGAAEYNQDFNPRHRRYADDDDDEFEAGEVYDRSAMLSEWRGQEGSAVVLGEIPAEDDEFSPPDVLATLEPDEQHFREATGNEGVSFERTYRQAALVVWPAEALFDILCQAGLQNTLPYLETLVGRWADSGEAPESPSWQEAHGLATAMLRQWAAQPGYPYRDKGPSNETRMLGLLIRLGDTTCIEQFLKTVIAAGCFAASDAVMVVEALDRLEPALAPGTGRAHRDGGWSNPPAGLRGLAATAGGRARGRVAAPALGECRTAERGPDALS